MPDEPYFILNEQGGVNTLHVEDTTADCGLADAEDLERIDPMTAEALLLRGDATACKHCDPRPVG